MKLHRMFSIVRAVKMIKSVQRARRLHSIVYNRFLRGDGIVQNRKMIVLRTKTFLDGHACKKKTDDLLTSKVLIRHSVKYVDMLALKFRVKCDREFYHRYLFRLGYSTLSFVPNLLQNASFYRTINNILIENESEGI